MKWIVENLQNALSTWNSKLSELMTLLTTSPQEFKNGTIWPVIEDIHGLMQTFGLALIILFFLAGVMKTCGSLAELKRPEVAVKTLLRFVIAKGVVTYGMELLLFFLTIAQGIVSATLASAPFAQPESMMALPEEIIASIEATSFLDSIPLWLVTLLGSLFITLMSFIMIMTVYGRFFKVYLYAALAPIPLATFAGEPTQQIGKSFLRSYAAVCLEGAVIVLACIIFSAFATTPPNVNPDAAAVTQVWNYVGELLFNMLVLVGTIKMADRVIREMTGL